MKYLVYNQEGKEEGSVSLPKHIFELKMNTDLVHQVSNSQRANRRILRAHTKTRGEVSGGGKKPWRQKGTGRARHGSTRSPIWVGGGAAFGPRKEKIYKKRIPKKIRRKALFMVLSNKAEGKEMIILDKLEIKEAKTKMAKGVIDKLRAKVKGFGKGSILFALAKEDKNVFLATRNIPKVSIIQASDLNALDLLSFKYLILLKDSIKVIEGTFSKKKEKEVLSKKVKKNVSTSGRAKRKGKKEESSK